ncbi:hypothetical protein AAFF_G00324460 [Aldrovandia affinis]|uniref:Uncharacterized protein n=1 Tax=Aldrovandia affinis TaxID=143900 RepID=A0AAD7R6N4_9TELE|nr:hypothetical protein AAFF_G00324460 [Aldrovandia affinis]
MRRVTLKRRILIQEAAREIAQTTMGIYIFQKEAGDADEESEDVGVLLEDASAVKGNAAGREHDVQELPAFTGVLSV